MCRAQGEAGCPHGRRCPPNATAREAALKRRRENRAIGQQIARWAKAEGKADELAELKRQRKPINEIKEWAEQAGASESVYARAAGPARRGWDARAVAEAAAPSAGGGQTPAAAPAEAPGRTAQRPPVTAAEAGSPARLRRSASASAMTNATLTIAIVTRRDTTSAWR